MNESGINKDYIQYSLFSFVGVFLFVLIHNLSSGAKCDSVCYLQETLAISILWQTAIFYNLFVMSFHSGNQYPLSYKTVLNIYGFHGLLLIFSFLIPPIFNACSQKN